jgi:hypothetical protein
MRDTSAPYEGSKYPASSLTFNSGVHIGDVAFMLSTWTQTRSLRSVLS